ncbi:MAG TPA: ABC transporter ATP-binding protein [Ktedonobacterales bacterium]|nr:ABC transporter ATP-binding protein [Ktedonobacterales bacterium]
MLQLQGVAVTYHGTITAVQDVSLEVPDRGIIALLGANGAGKTTILRAITGLLRLHGGRIARGSILFDGQRIDTLDATRIVRRGIAQVLEGRRLFSELTVEENLRTGAFANPDPASIQQAYTRVMELFPVLRERRQSIAGYLSGGQQQMLAIGRGLMANPRLLLLDEPSLGLAPMMIQQITGIIADIAASGTAVLLVEQNAQMALSLASYGYVLETGKIALAASAGELMQDEAVRTFYLGLHEGAEHAQFSTLRLQRPERKWAL